jgi:signal transduction histidine kinase
MGPDDAMTEILSNDVKQIFGCHHAAFEPLMAELWAAREKDAPAASVRFAAADALAAECLRAGIAPSQAVRLVLSGGRALIESAEGQTLLEAASARRLSTLVDEAAVQVAAAIESARGGRRQAFLSFLVHELKNPLNTILNALWLLKEKGGDPKQSARFMELAERAVKRLESRTRDVRELDEQLVTPPPGWEDKQLQRPSAT